MATAAEVFYSNVEIVNGCWEWQGATLENGYGIVHLGMSDGPYHSFAQHGYVHRVSYEMHNGPIPTGMHVLHRCDNRRCLNPDHLFLGTQKDNAADMVAKGRHGNQRKTHCPNGHPYDAENTYIYGTNRKCRACHRENERRRRDPEIIYARSQTGAC